MNDNSGSAMLGFTIFILALAWMNKRKKKSDAPPSTRPSDNTNPKKIDPYIDHMNKQDAERLNDGNDG